MKYYTVGLFALVASTLAQSEMLNTGSNDYYMTPPASYPSSPVVESISVQEQCWYEQVPISGVSQPDENPNVAGAVVGGIIGGIVGHQFGSGSGNTAATVAGAAIGTAVGASSGNNTPTTPQYQLIRKCNTVR
ncbi:glycine zipper 2TM domain-containing protein [Sulfuricurvum sp.]|uniref:glycine zipper 2TM domain-containing protein n=1 Tax=Sulfuricurvum sp. TaxID=2025608 RepID=UPI002E340148|nr:glycine zipper 2TM domain-containing protein [Sulfuricurvum sp.]HEX5329906.1 glycine zipper 2TM domain-containing protein [Sulfuricurvum sp.]